MTKKIFDITEAQKKNMVYNVNPDLMAGFQRCVRDGQVRMALEYMAYIMQNWSDEMGLSEALLAVEEIPVEAETTEAKPVKARNAKVLDASTAEDE